MGKDVLKGGGGADRIFIDGAGANNKAIGGGGRDYITFGAGRDTANGGNGQDFLEWSAGFGSSGIDFKTDQADGGNGTDVLDLNFSFALGVETVSLVENEDGVRVALVNGREVIQYTNFERIELQTPAGSDLVAFDGTDQIEIASLLTGSHTASLGGGNDGVGLYLDTEKDVLDFGAGDEDLLRVSFGDIETDILFDGRAGTLSTEGEVVLGILERRNSQHHRQRDVE